MKLAVLGIGSLRSGPPVVAALANYFGERELEVRLYDSDDERLDLFDRLARACFVVEKARHRLFSFNDHREALDEADAAIVCVGFNCARKLLGIKQEEPPAEEQAPLHPVERAAECGPVSGMPRSWYYGEPPKPEFRAQVLRSALDILLEEVPADLPLLDMMRGAKLSGKRVSRLEWPDALGEEERLALAHQVLRWVKGDEYLHTLLNAHRLSPIKRWLNDSWREA